MRNTFLAGLPVVISLLSKTEKMLVILDCVKKIHVAFNWVGLSSRVLPSFVLNC